jgi:endogenous inhibitor of DNA gyrase (YacG/DUF329 family)
MDMHQSKTARKVGAPCPHCGREFWLGKRSGRRRHFCSNACRQAHFRNAEWDRRYQVPDPLRNAKNNPTTSAVCEGKNRGRGSILSPADWPIDLLGGCRRGSGLDPELARKIIEIECGIRLKGGKR